MLRLTFGVGTGVAQINGFGCPILVQVARLNSPILQERMDLDKSAFYFKCSPPNLMSGTFYNGVLNRPTSNSLTFINNATKLRAAS